MSLEQTSIASILIKGVLSTLFLKEGATGLIVTTADLEEAERELNTELENLKWYPVVAIGMSYRF